MRRRPVLRVLAVAGLMGLPGSAAATEGNLYLYGASIWAVGSQFSAGPTGTAWLVQAPLLASAVAGNKWEMNWGCPVGGSEVASVHWSALRTQAPSSLALQVTGDRVALWSEGDVGMPQSPAAGRPYDIGLPGGHCNVHLTLTQVETRAQHARGYFIDSPRILVRDLTAPSTAITSVSGG